MRQLLALIAIAALAACGESRDQGATPAIPPASVPALVPISVPVAQPTSAVPALDSTALMKCAGDTNPVTRLSCFDDFAKANGLAPSSKEVAANSTGKWRISSDKDPLTDKSVHYAMLDADEGGGRFGKSYLLIVRCKSGKTEAFLNWDTFLGSDGLNVTSRIDKVPATTSYWSISTDHKASFMPQQVATLKKFEGASSYVVNLTPYSESPITAIFDVTGANEAFKDIRRDCRW
jgi:type VI secretion system protein VasI